jgi:DNA-binding CsgD family transcriptional regulator
MYAEILLWKGDWVEAEDAAAEVLGSHSHAETIAWRVLGTLQARRGRAEASATLDRMWLLAEASGELQNLDPATAGLAEYMWLSGEQDPNLVVRLRAVLDKGLRSGYSWPSGALAFWAWKLGILATVPDGLPDFYRWIMEGEWQKAADFWEARGIPYERALALMHGDDAAQIQSIRILEGLGATVTANHIRRELLDKGVRVPRGAATSTREHSAGLTARQAEVLELVAEGLTNAEIADQLFVSYRTVENHVAAVLMKLDVSTREAAVEAAHDRGILAVH